VGVISVTDLGGEDGIKMGGVRCKKTNGSMDGNTEMGIYV
jgi:hypothetical protein